MTPKQKGNEIIKKFVNVECLQDFGGMNINLAIECTKVCLDEILEIVKDSKIKEEYYNAIKSELNNFSECPQCNNLMHDGKCENKCCKQH